MEEENKEVPTLKDTLKEMKERVDNLEDKKKAKKFNFKLPFKARPNKKQLKTNWITLLYINENKNAEYIKAPIEEGVILVDGVPHVPTPESIITYRGKPMLIQPAWNTQPFMPDEDYQRAKDDGTMSKGWKLILNRYKNEAIAVKKQWGSGALIIGIIVLIGVGYLALKGGKLF